MALRLTKAELKTYQLNLDGGAERVCGKGKRRNLEAQSQALLFRRRKELLEIWPQLRYLFATLNGLYIPPHLRAKAVEAGLIEGPLDMWYVAQHHDPDGTIFGALVMDLKIPPNGPSDEQLKWAAHLVKNGCRVYFPTSALEAWWLFCCYAGIHGADHWAADLAHAEAQTRLLAG
jgi:hypothetical protein